MINNSSLKDLYTLTSRCFCLTTDLQSIIIEAKEVMDTEIRRQKKLKMNGGYLLISS